MSRFLYVLMIFSYCLLFGVGTAVFLGSAYVMFLAPLETLDPSLRNQNSPLWQKVGYLAFVFSMIVAGYGINRVVWGRFLGKKRRHH